jgi:putative glutamine amidotransferase
MRRLVSAYYTGFYPFTCLSEETPISTCDPDDLKPDDILLVWGGADISPVLYGKTMSRYSHANPNGPSPRDLVEWNLMQRAGKLGVPIIGICRGAQMLCAAAGGYLIQDITGHAGPNHGITTVNGDTYQVNSLHHQMMVPYDSKHKLLGWSDHRRSAHYYDENVDVEMEIEPELIHFTEFKGIGAQWHPEMMSYNAPATKMLIQHIKDIL